MTPAGHVTSLFVSDLHLDPERPAAVNAFLEFLERGTRPGDRLFILGDLFEAWIGDDDDAPWLAPILEGLATLTERGVDCAFMHGNRDFLIGEQFAAATGVRLLAEYELVELGDEQVLLTHGDLLCTDDVRYMALRTQLRDPAWQREFLGKDLDERRRIALELRALSKTEMAGKSEKIMDVSPDTVDATMQRFGVTSMIHGHTHRPAIHRWHLDGAPARRIVLGDWYESASCLVWDADGPRPSPLNC